MKRSKNKIREEKIGSENASRLPPLRNKKRKKYGKSAGIIKSRELEK